VDSGKKMLRFLTWLGVAMLQLIMAQVVTFLLSLFVPGMENFPQDHPALFVVILGVTFSTGVFLIGWLALKLRWLATKPKYAHRLVATLIGAYLPLILALILYHTLEPGNPFFFISMLISVLGFHVPGWIERK
jgi:predicted Abi (CAAX) family protease